MGLPAGQQIYFSYQRRDTKQFHEFTFTSWAAALEFARLADSSPETQLLCLKLVPTDRVYRSQDPL